MIEKKFDVTSPSNSFFVKNFFINLIALRALTERLIMWAIWSDHWSFESKMMPKILIDFFETTSLPLIMILMGAVSPL